MNRPSILLEDLLDALMLEESEPSYAALMRWSERYPEHGKALAEFFATWGVQAEMPQQIEVDEDRLANIAVSHALDIMHRRDEAAKGVPKDSARTTQPRLLAYARAAGISDEQLAAHAGLDTMIIEKLDLRRLTSIPQMCFARLATVLSIVPDRIQEMATGPPLVAASVRHKARRKPTLTTEDFATAIRNSSLPDDAKRFWLDTIAAEEEGAKE